jgi:hypothetical protein
MVERLSMPVESLRVSGRSAVEVMGDDESNEEQLMRNAGQAALYIRAGGVYLQEQMQCFRVNSLGDNAGEKRRVLERRRD